MRKICRRRITLYEGQISDLFSGILRGRYSETAAVYMFENALARHFGKKFAVCLGSGREAILQTLKAVSGGGTVVLPGWTLGALAEYLINHDIKIRLCDIDPMTGAMIPDKLDTTGVSAVLLTHPFGMPAQVDRWQKLCAEKGIRIVHDCAQTLGAFWDNKPVASTADAACFSLEFSKEINTFGGGAVVTSDETICRRLKKARLESRFDRPSFLRKAAIALAEEAIVGNPLLFEHIAWPFLSSPESSSRAVSLYRTIKKKTSSKAGRYTGLQALMGNAGLIYLDNTVQTRRRAAAIYRDILGDFLRFQPDGGKITHSYTYLVAMTPGKASETARKARASGVDMGTGDQIFHHIGRLTGLKTHLPGTDEAWERALLLPFHSRISPDEAGLAARRIRKIIKDSE